jgi:hypothetical protein
MLLKSGAPWWPASRPIRWHLSLKPSGRSCSLVYRRARILKPRNVGFKDLPPAEMETLLLASIPVTEEHMRELAQARGVAVKDYLSSRELGLDRLFLGAAKMEVADGKWAPHAELSLTMK